MRWLILAVLILLPSPLHPERHELENIRIISAASQYPVYEHHKTRRTKIEKISTLEMELSAEMARQARRSDRTVPRRLSKQD